MIKQYRIGFKGRKQLPWLMIWVEYYDDLDTIGDPVHASVIYSSGDWGLRKKFHEAKQ